MRLILTSQFKSLNIAKLLSTIFHPWIVLAPVLALAAYRDLNHPLDAFKWTLIAYVPTIIFPLVYGKLIALKSSKKGTRKKISRSLFRGSPRSLLVLAALFGIPSILVLQFLHGPACLLTIILAVMITMLAITIVNIFYRASFHIGMATCMLTSMVFLFGPVALISFILIPILSVSRYQLGEHTISQIITGFLIGLIVSGATFYSLGLAAY
ncbi:MAG: hypothetical protein RBT40_02055 [Petrimonas sp.]|jgi:membrane-associated phospholipid phosphatase|nr:hypothetical protein [Petrimonas sp.]